MNIRDLNQSVLSLWLQSLSELQHDICAAKQLTSTFSSLPTKVLVGQLHTASKMPGLSMAQQLQQQHCPVLLA